MSLKYTATGPGSQALFAPSSFERKTEIVPLQPTMGTNKWWARPSGAVNSAASGSGETAQVGGTKWTTLDHNGILFAPPYEPHNVPVFYKGEPVVLTPEQEEVATFFASVLGSDHAENPKFVANFFRDWRALLGKKHLITDVSHCDFSKIKEHLDRERELKKEKKSAEVRKAAKEEKARLDSLYGFALVDGFRESVGNYKVEIPSLFRGRGEHPKTGSVKKRVMPEDVVINIGRGSKIPSCPIEGHDWKGVIHNADVTWLAYYKDSITDQFKYVYLASSSRFKGESDRNKYNKARRLLRVIDKIRDGYTTGMKPSQPLRLRQLSTAVYLIDRLALRVGNEKDTSEEADTVGCCSLRVEHLSFPATTSAAPATSTGGADAAAKNSNCRVVFDFLGKDSMRYFNEVAVDPQVYENLKEFCRGKRADEDVFNVINTTALNDYLKQVMPGLTAKVFRTYNASVTLEKELRDGDKDVELDDLLAVKEQFYTNANREVAILCNHQRSLPKAHETQMEKMTDQLELLEKEVAALKGKATTFNDKKLPADKEKRKAALVRLETRLKNHKTKMSMKDENKTVALGTSKINYMDPRITVAWCKARDVPIERVFNKSLLSKFPWAMEVPSTWRFDNVNDPELDGIINGDDDDDGDNDDGEGDNEDGDDED